VSEGKLRLAIAMLALAGAVVVSYLAYVRYSGTQIACATGGCETVQRSRYAELAGVPVAVLGVVFYLALLATAAARGPAAAAAGAVLTLGGALFGGYLVILQVVVIDAVCQWCLASDTLVAAAAVFAVLRLQRAAPPASQVREST
jgi:uncharacterized membrane protein